ncbi:ABC transporter permease [Fulvivirgaceae bacterium BMA12]|uniref:ABC transporter permease n=1 Tax=Agaribacillus aureus TaxID=3051825 RepID=A0ABT8LD35_9BACT|nr:ABC transporter permease [Fulvivirgaceae bacterium BMA12]
MYLKLAWRNIWRNKRRTLITLASIAFAVFFASITQSMQLGTYANMISNSVRFYTGYAQIHKSGYWEEKSLDNSFALPENITEVLAGNKSIAGMIPRVESFSLVAYGEKAKAAMLIGIDPMKENELTSLKKRLTKGQYLAGNENSLMMGQGLADYLNVSIGDTLALIGQGYHGINAVGKYHVKGIIETPIAAFNDQAIYLPLATAQFYFGMEDQVTSLAINVDDEAKLERLKAHINNQLGSDEYEVMTWREMMPELVQQIELDYVSGRIILFILYIIIGFGMFGTFLMMAKERTYEFGILVAIGMRRMRLKLLSLLELVMLSFGGVLLGVIISLPILTILHFNPIPISGEYAEVYKKFGIEPVLNFSISPVIFTDQATIILVLSLLLGIYPVWHIHRLRVVEAIRS